MPELYLANSFVTITALFYSLPCFPAHSELVEEFLPSHCHCEARSAVAISMLPTVILIPPPVILSLSKNLGEEENDPGNTWVI